MRWTPAVDQPTGVSARELVIMVSRGGHFGPQEAGQLTGDGDSDHVVAGLAGGEAAVAGGPRPGDGGRAGVVLAPAQERADRGVVPSEAEEPAVPC